MTTINNTIVGIGELLWDILPEGKKIGGAPTNFAYHTSQFGLNGVAVSALGKDQLGDEIEANLNNKYLHYIAERVDFPTGTVQVEVDVKGIPHYDIKENVAWDNIPYTPELEELAKNTKVVCFGSLAQRNHVSRETITHFIEVMDGKSDCHKIFDINLRQNFYTKEILHHSMSLCNILKINDEELELICKIFDYPDLEIEEQCKSLLNIYNLKMLILTCGVHGSYVFTSDKSSFLETPRVHVADTVGAGDSFTASFICAIIKGKTLEQAHQIAVDVSAYICTQHGAMAQLPDNLRIF